MNGLAKNRWGAVIGVVSLFVVWMVPSATPQGLNFSVDAGALGAAGDEADIHYTPLDGTNSVVIPKAMLGLTSGDNVDALCIVDGTNADAEEMNWPTLFWHFSVDPAAVGLATTAVNTEATAIEASGDVFWMNAGTNLGSNTQAVDEVVEGLTATQNPEDDLDGLDLKGYAVTPPVGVITVYFSLTPGSPSLGMLYTAADILQSPLDGTFSQAYSDVQLGIHNEDLDALFMDAFGVPFFSLAPGSLLYPPGDVYYSLRNGTTPVLVYTAAQLGLAGGLAGDNLNALDVIDHAFDGGGEVEPCPNAVYIPNVPDASQPPASGSGSWCSPTAALNVVAYWELVAMSPNSQALLDPADIVGQTVRPGSTTSDHIGWFMDTSNMGSPARMNMGSQGTMDMDIMPGLDEFLRWDSAALFGNVAPMYGKSAHAWSLGYSFRPAIPEALAWIELMQEIDAGRPLIMSFAHWSLGNSATNSVGAPPSSVSVTFYDWGAPATSGDSDGDSTPDEFWDIGSGIGHTVTAVGYVIGCDPDGFGPLPTADWVIVHDNWSSTPVDVAVPWVDTANMPPNDPATVLGDPLATGWWKSHVPADPERDSDGDGLPDWWEDKYGLDPNDDGSVDPDNGPNGDPDDDGYTNDDEYDADTDPTDPDSHPPAMPTGEWFVWGVLIAVIAVSVRYVGRRRMGISPTLRP